MTPRSFFMSSKSWNDSMRSDFCRSSANTQRSRMFAHHPSCEEELRQEIKQLHPSYLLNSFSLEDASVGGQSCTWILKLQKRLSFSPHQALSFLAHHAPVLLALLGLFPKYTKPLQKPGLDYHCSSGWAPHSSSAAHRWPFSNLSKEAFPDPPLPGSSLASDPVHIWTSCVFVFGTQQHINSWCTLSWWRVES